MDTLLTLDWSALFAQAAPLMLLAGLAVVVLLSQMACKRFTVQIAMLGTVVVALFAIPQWYAAETTAPMALFYFDRLSWIGVGIILVALFAALLTAPAYLRARGLPLGEFFALLFFGAAGLWAMMATHHLIVVFVGLETLSLAAYVLAAYHRTDRRSIEAGIKYFLLGAVASAFLLFGMAFLYGGTGTLDLLMLKSMNGGDLAPAQALYTTIGLASILIGFCFKVSAAPFHFWTPDVYSGSPLPVTTFFATAVKSAAFIAFWRLALSAGPLAGSAWTTVLWAIAVLTMTIGNLAALTQDDMKRMLAYSSIAHAGYALTALLVARTTGTVVGASLLFYLVSYTVMTIGAFTLLMAMSHATKEATSLQHVAGLASRRPGLAALFALFMLSLAGIPPTIGFFAKYYLFQAAVGAGFVWLVIIAVLNSVLSVAYYIRPVVAIYFQPDPGPAGTDRPLAYGTRLVLGLAALSVLLGGLFPGRLLELLLASI